MKTSKVNYLDRILLHFGLVRIKRLESAPQLGGCCTMPEDHLISILRPRLQRRKGL